MKKELNQEEKKYLVQMKKRYIVIIVALFVIIFILLGFVFYLWTKILIKEQESTTQIVIDNFQQKVDEQSEDENKDFTANWQVYINEKYGFSFKYPKSWPTPFMSTALSGDDYLANEIPKWKLSIGNVTNDFYEGDGRYKLYFEGLSARDRINTINELNKNEMTSVISNVVVNGINMIIYNEGGICGFKNALIFSDNQTIKFTSFCGADSLDLSRQFEDILSTFKFNEFKNKVENSQEFGISKTKNNIQLEGLIEEHLLNMDSDITNESINKYSVFEEIPSPFSDKIAVLYGIDIEKNGECCDRPTEMFIVDENGELINKFVRLQGALQYLYLDDVRWLDDDTIFYNEVLISEGTGDHSVNSKKLIIK